ncbi:MAG: hypothetical protein A2W91_04250 [Bacteroidetes bacterium GWF2_38_335]|nr:MAG: hypothetical protein A2W91_04250 [Bacteroidetes bacterium GWF2_38_335]HBS88751.1 hypothetical protein [Bacteroidales bacterium]
MKKTILTFTIALVAWACQSQSFEKGTSVISAGVGIGGNYNASGYYSSQSPAIGISFEKGLIEDVGPGIISGGFYLGYKSLTYHYNYGYNNFFYDWKWSYTIIGLRGAYHYPLDNEKLDVYGGIMIGFNYCKFSEKTNDPTYYDYQHTYSQNSYLNTTFFAGGRYYFTENLGGFAEVGYGIAYLTIGINYKF